MAGRLKFRKSGCALLLVFALPCLAGNLPDPTRPAGEAAAGDEVSAGPVLQSVLISPGRRSAIISGERVTVGSRYGDAKVVRITESEVVLKSGNEVQTLKLFPAVGKTAARRTARVSGHEVQSGQKAK